MATFRWIIALALLTVLVIFGLRNSATITVDYYLGTARLPLFLLMAVLVLAGAAATALVGIAEQVRLQARIRALRRRVRDLEKETEPIREASAADPGGPTGQPGGTGSDESD